MVSLAIRSFVVVLVCWGSLAQAQNYDLLGRKVMTIYWDVKFTEGTSVVFKSELGKVYRVEQVSGKWLRLVGEGRQGWVDQSDVVAYDDAIDYFNTLVQQNPSNKHYYHRALAWKAKGEFDSALRDFDEAIRRGASSKIYNARGTTWILNGEYDKAIADYSKAIKMNSNDPVAFYNRGVAWAHKGDYDKAIANSNESIRINPKIVPPYVTRGSAWFFKGDYDKAIADYSEAIRIDPNNAQALCNRALGWNSMSQFNKAIADFSEAFRLDPKNADAYNGLAWLRATCTDETYRNGPQAVEYATNACELTDWKDYKFVSTLSAAYATAGDFENAKKWLAKTIELNPDGHKEIHDDMSAAYEAKRPYIEQPKAPAL